MSNIFYAQLSLDRSPLEPRQSGRYLTACSFCGLRQENLRAVTMQPMYAYALTRWVNPILDYIADAMARRAPPNEHPVFVIIACKGGNHRSVATVEHVADTLPQRIHCCVFVWHWSYIARSPQAYVQAKAFFQELLEHCFPDLYLPLHSRVLLDDGNDMRIGVIVNMRDTTRGARRLKGYGFIDYLASGSTIRRCFFHTDNVVNWHRIDAWVENGVFRELRGALVQFAVAEDAFGQRPSAYQVHIFANCVPAERLRGP